MFWSGLHIPTQREFPAEAKSPAHGLLIRAGYMRAARADESPWLFLGERALEKIRRLGQREISSETFTRCGIRLSEPQEEFRVRSAAAGDAAVECPGCGYFASLDEAVFRAVAVAAPDPLTEASPEAFHTPDCKTIAEVAEFTGLPRTSQIKSLVMTVHGEPILALVRGDHHLSRRKLARFLIWKDAKDEDDAVPAQPAQIARWFGADPGSLGPVGIFNMKIVADYALAGRRNMIAGANRNDYHLRNVTPGRDFNGLFADLRQAGEGDLCAHCGTALALSAQKLMRLTDAAGSIEAERALFATAEQNSDDAGLVLAPSIAPFTVIVTPVNDADPAMHDVASKIYADCLAAGIDALYDDRDQRPGVKFKDADLIGIPYRITIGKKLQQGLAEVTDRRRRSARDVPVLDARWPALLKSDVLRNNAIPETD